MRGDRFKKHLPSFIGKIDDVSDLFYAEDTEFERLDELLNDFTHGLYASEIGKTSNPDYFLRLLEKDYKLESSGSIEDRIKAILLKMRGKRVTTEQVLIEICDAYGVQAKYEERYREYGFLLSLYYAYHYDMEKMIGAILEVIPAHLEPMFRLIIKNDIVLKEKTTALTNRFYMTGIHKTGTVPKHQYVGVKSRDNINIPNRSSDHSNRYTQTGERKAGK